MTDAPAPRRARRGLRIPALVMITFLVAAVGQVIAPAGARASGPAPLTPVTPASTGWQVPLAHDLAPVGERFSSPAVGDVLGNGGTEIVTGFPDGTVRVFSTSGQTLLSYYTGAGAVEASPALVDVNHDGIKDIVAANLAGDVVAFDGRGRTLFHQHAGSGKMGVFGTPAVADLEGNGRLDIVSTSWNQYVYAWHVDNGSLVAGWPVHVGDTIWSSPTIAHLDGDPLPEVVFGFDCDGAPGQWCAPNPGGYLGVLTHNGAWRPGFPVFLPHQVAWSTPAVADLEGNGHPDIVIGTGNMSASMCCHVPMQGTVVYAFRSNGRPVPGWPARIGVNASSSPAIGDLEGNGTLDVAIVGEDGRVHVFGHDGVQRWSACINDAYASGCNEHFHASATIGDVYANGHQDLVVGGEQWVYVFDGQGNRIAAAPAAPQTDPLTATPTLASVNGKTWIVEESTAETSAGVMGRVFVWTTGTALGATDWPTFKGGPARSGVLRDRVPPPPPPPTSRGTTLDSPATLTENQYLQSPNKHYVVKLQPDGNLVAYAGSQPYWQSNTHSFVSSFSVQNDGNMVVYDEFGTPLWSSRTGGTGPGRLVLQDDGNLVLYTGRGAVWAIGAPGKPLLTAPSTLRATQSLQSLDRRFTAVMQADGNLVVYDRSRALWATGTRTPGSSLAVQADGNLVIYSTRGQALWASGTHSSGAIQLQMQLDGNLVLYGSGRAIWASHT